MRLYLRAVGGLSRGFAVIGAASLILVMALTILDVILRAFGRPIIGTYEMVALDPGIFGSSSFSPLLPGIHRFADVDATVIDNIGFNHFFTITLHNLSE